MKTKIIQIGNSHGVRIPKPLLDQVGLQGVVEIRAAKDALILRSVKQPRAGWAEAFRKMATNGEDALLDGDQIGPTDWDKSQWQW